MLSSWLGLIFTRQLFTKNQLLKPLFGIGFSWHTGAWMRAQSRRSLLPRPLARWSEATIWAFSAYFFICKKRTSDQVVHKVASWTKVRSRIETWLGSLETLLNLMQYAEFPWVGEVLESLFYITPVQIKELDLKMYKPSPFLVFYRVW